jgi:glutamyl-tRNA synthetase
MTQKAVCTRIAPSPTGDPHIGTVFMALFNYAFAKKHGGRFILRVEDTDRVRSTVASEKMIFDSLAWAGVQHDEGPDIGGGFGPYRQSERFEIYKKHVQILIDGGHAYPCFCSPERLSTLRQEQMARKDDPKYDAHCMGMDPAESARRIAAGENYVIRLKVPEQGDCVVPERLRGEISIGWSTVDHQVLQKTDGFPTYHLANVVDDHLMGVSHVIRGEEWISSLPKHVLLYKAFGWDLPEFIHMPLLRNPDKSKLSKRKNPTSVFYYRDAGILPEALLNYLGMMGYTHPDGQEMFSLDAFVEQFDIDRVALGGPVFDMTKLTWLNGRYLREGRSPQDILDDLKAWRLNDDFLLKVLSLAQKRLGSLGDFLPMVAYLFTDALDYEPSTLITKKLDGENTARLLRLVAWELDRVSVWDAETLKTLFEKVAEKEDMKLRDLLAPAFIAVSGRPVALPLFDSIEILGLDLSRRRFAKALDHLEKLGFPLKGKALKRLQKDYQARY